jgi:hypothetical protein
MIGAALLVTWAAIPAATPAPASRSNGRPSRPSRSEACTNLGSAAGLIASCGARTDAGGRSSSRAWTTRTGCTVEVTARRGRVDVRVLGTAGRLRSAADGRWTLAERGDAIRARGDGTERTGADRAGTD